MDPLADLEKANEITVRILTGGDVSDADYRFVVMFNFLAMTQLLWELANPGKSCPYNSNELLPRGKNRPTASTSSIRESWGKKLFPLLTLGGFLAGLGLGYLMP